MKTQVKTKLTTSGAFTGAQAYTVEGYGAHYIEMDWAGFVAGLSGDAAAKLTGMAADMYSRYGTDLRKHLKDTPMDDFTSMDSLRDKLDATLMADMRDRIKRKKVDTWDGSDLEIDTIINRRGIPFSERRKQSKPRPVLVIAQRLAHTFTAGGVHAWNAAQGLWLSEYFTSKGYDIEFYAYTDHMDKDRLPSDERGRVLTSVKLKGRGDRLYHEILRRALADRKVYQASWWPMRAITGTPWATAYGHYQHRTGKYFDQFSWAQGAKCINLPLAYNEQECISNIQAVLNNDQRFVSDNRDS